MAKRMIAAAAVVALAMGGAALAGPEKIEFPKDYKTSFTHFTTRDMHRGNNVIADIYANTVALEAAKADELPAGSIILMETFTAKLDAQQQPLIDANGRMIKDQVRGIVIMEKRAGWGAAYPEDVRNGDWEYAAFSPAGVRGTGATASCFECHGGVKDLDYVFAKPDLAEFVK
jgi:hypothetical protein